MKDLLKKVFVGGFALSLLGFANMPGAEARDHWRYYERGGYRTYYDLPMGSVVEVRRGYGPGFYHRGNWHRAYFNDGRWGVRERVYY